MRHCSFCSLLCSYEREQELADCSLRTRSIGDIKNRRAKVPLVDGRETSLKVAIDAARRYLDGAPAVLVSGKIFSLETSRAAIELARSLGAMIDLADSQSAFDWLQAVQSGGAFTTTINEARFRSDLIVLVGNDADFEKHPRILQQLLDCPAPLYERRLLFVGDFSLSFLQKCQTIAGSCGVSKTGNIQVTTKELWRIFKANAVTMPEVHDNPHLMIAQQMRQSVEESEYAVFVFSTTADRENGIEVYRSLNDFILNLASERKVAALPLSSSALMFSQCCTWQTGFPGRIAFVDQIARYNPWLNVANKWVERTRSDAITVVVNESVDQSNIVIRGVGNTQQQALVQIPVAAVGEDCLATFYKADGSTMISAGKSSKLPSAGEALKMILAND